MTFTRRATVDYQSWGKRPASRAAGIGRRAFWKSVLPARSSTHSASDWVPDVISKPSTAPRRKTIFNRGSARPGARESGLSRKTCQSVFQATGGVPRLINQVCDHSMLLSYVAGKKTIEPVNIEESWADLQQLPTPWNGESKSDQASGGVIELALGGHGRRLGRAEERLEAAGDHVEGRPGRRGT